MSKIKTVALISPSFRLSERSIYIEKYVKYLQSFGLKVIIPPHADYFSAMTTKAVFDKSSDIMNMYLSPSVDALVCIHGGAGALNILEHLDYNIIKQNPKPIFGFSDNTSIQMAVYAQTKTPFVTGLAVEYDLREGNLSDIASDDLKNILAGNLLSIKSGTTANHGFTEGVLLGECLSTISDLNGTPYYPDISDSILLLEDVEEVSYKLDLMLTQLRLNPQFKFVRGIILGKFHQCYDNSAYGKLDDIIERFCSSAPMPIIKDFEFSHQHSRHILPCGVKYRLDADNCTLTQLESL